MEKANQQWNLASTFDSTQKVFENVRDGIHMHSTQMHAYTHAR